MAHGMKKVDYDLLVTKLEQCCACTAGESVVDRGGSGRGDQIIRNQIDQMTRQGPSKSQSSSTISDDEDIIIPLAAYLDAFRQLHTFFCAMGKIFDLVASEIGSKVAVLECYVQDADVGHHYADVRRMLVYESDNNLLRDTRKPSGSRTLLRLHRGLEFVYTLLELIVDLPADEKIASKATEAYKTTLGKYHPWAIYYGMLLALKTLSTTKVLVKHTTDQSVEEFRMRTVPDIIRVGKRTHELIEDLYASRGCLDLP